MKKNSKDFNYTSTLAGILQTHNKTFSRELRGIIHFSIEEIITISRYLDISLDSLYTHSKTAKKHLLEIYLYDFTILKEYETIIQDTMYVFIFASESTVSNYIVSTNNIPHIVYNNHSCITRLYYMRWYHYSKGIKNVPALSTINLTEGEKKIRRISQMPLHK